MQAADNNSSPTTEGSWQKFPEESSDAFAAFTVYLELWPGGWGRTGLSRHSATAAADGDLAFLGFLLPVLGVDS